MKKLKKLNVLGICAGQGVCLYPFHRSKYFRVIGNIEPRGVFYAKGNPQWKANFGDIPMDKQLKIKGRVDIIIGHPDCGDSSILRMSRAKQKGSVDSNLSIQVFLLAITSYKPRLFLLENLPGFLKSFPVEELSALFGGGVSNTEPCSSCNCFRKLPSLSSSVSIAWYP